MGYAVGVSTLPSTSPAAGRRALILVDHGSRRPEPAAVLEALAASVAARLPGTLVRCAHMELEPPTIADAVDACVAEGAREIVVYPHMLAPGRHAAEDIPRLAAEAVARHPEVRFEVTDCLGADDALVEIILARVAAVAEP